MCKPAPGSTLAPFVLFFYVALFFCFVFVLVCTCTFVNGPNFFLEQVNKEICKSDNIHIV